MRQIYVISLFFLPFWCFSQLYIKPNGIKESFLYARGGMVYVEKNIHLVKNPSGSLEASLYLRNEAQLLQGDEYSKNTGTGFLSVFQEGKATAYTYNYWSSPVENSTGNTLFGNILYEPLTRTHSQKAIISQELNGQANPLKISNRWIYKLSGSGYSDWEYIGNTFNIAPGEGFTMKGVDGTNTEVKLYGVANNPGNEQRYDFRGKPNTGTISLDIRKDEILLVGNPYPSALDLNSFLQENTNTTGIAYFWDSRPVSSHYLKDYEGGYGAYSPALGRSGYVPAVFKTYDESGNALTETGRAGEYYARGFSPIGQGFIVEGLSTGNVYFRNRYREFQKENPERSEFKIAGEESTREISVIRLNIGFENKYVRQLILAYHPQATSGADRAMDAKNLSPLETDAGWKINDEMYLIDIRNDRSIPVPLWITTTQPLDITLSLKEQSPGEMNIYVWDKEKDVYYNLKDQEITIPVTEGNTEDLYITSNKKFPDKENPVSGREYRIFQNNAYNRTEVVSPLTFPPESIGIFDSRGRKVKEIKGSTNDLYYEIPTGNLSRGIYIIKITSGDGTTVSKKVIISN